MSIDELTDYLQRQDMVSVRIRNSVKRFVLGDAVYKNGKWNNATDVFGIYQGEDGQYCFFVSDSERGIPDYSVVCQSESEACDALIAKISRAKRIHQKSGEE